MERFILKELLEWKNSPYRKPLILKGVRQVGKTWILKEFGRRYYENTAYFNFDENEEYKQFFETTKDISRILQNLMLASGQKIVPEKTLIIFDEVQDCPKVINSISVRMLRSITLPVQVHFWALLWQSLHLFLLAKLTLCKLIL